MVITATGLHYIEVQDIGYPGFCLSPCHTTGHDINTIILYLIHCVGQTGMCSNIRPTGHYKLNPGELLCYNQIYN